MRGQEAADGQADRQSSVMTANEEEGKEGEKVRMAVPGRNLSSTRRPWACAVTTRCKRWLDHGSDERVVTTGLLAVRRGEEGEKARWRLTA